MFADCGLHETKGFEVISSLSVSAVKCTFVRKPIAGWGLFLIGMGRIRGPGSSVTTNFLFSYKQRLEIKW